VGGARQALVQPAGIVGRATSVGMWGVDCATAIVYRGDDVVGTAFLAAPDLVLTAAHVVVRNNGIDFQPALVDRLAFSFRAPGEDMQPPIWAYPNASNALVDCSMPWGRPPNLLSIAPQEESPKRLDFALIRLDREIRHAKPLNVESPPKPESGDALVILGFPGGTAMRWDRGDVAAVESPRLQHRANALSGMSGSCCINVDGRPVALHEGSLATRLFAIGGAQPADVNRAMCLWAIRNAMRAGSADPLQKRNRTPALEFQDEAIVRRWAKAGLRYAPQAMVEQWRLFVQAAIGAQPDETGTVASFHPWFRRDVFEDWIDQHAGAGAPKRRLCMVHGNPGTGKTFLASILRKRVPDAVMDAVVISATETTAWSWRDAIESWGVSTDSAGDMRPDAGVATHDEAPNAARRIANYGDRSRDRASAKPLFVFIDFDGTASFPLGEEPPWLPFMSELLGYPWVRLVVTGAPESVASGLIDLMESKNEEGPLRITLEHVGRMEFGEFARRLLRKGGPPVPSAQIEEATNSLTRILQAFPSPDLSTAAAVMAAILLQKQVGS